MVNFNKVKDSGHRQKFKSGAVRDRQFGKGRFDLLPCHAILRLAKHFENGASKYKNRNWEKGMPLSRYIDSAIRHLFQFLEGNRDEDHMAAVMWNAACFIETEKWINEGKLHKELDDMP